MSHSDEAWAALTGERDHFKVLSEQYAQRILEQSAIINDLQVVVRQARAVANTAKRLSPFDTLTQFVSTIDESFLEDLRAALAAVGSSVERE